MDHPTTPPLALTMGDPGGVGVEVTLKAWRKLCNDGPVFFLIGDPESLEPNGAISVIEQPQQAADVFKNALPVLPVTATVRSKPGVSSPENAAAVLQSIKRAVEYATNNLVSGIITNPIQKSSLIAAGFQFPGHTEFLAALTKDMPMPHGRQRGAVMMLTSPALRAIPVTIHLSVAEAIRGLTPNMIIQTAMIVDETLRLDFGINEPRIAISGLNPHAGEAGALGMEDQLIIAPAIDELRMSGINVRGPLSADTMFHEDARKTYDAALCMLHDQALIPAKTLAFHDGVNVTLGLPVIRTSPDHGTALDIAGTGAARADSLIAAIHLAAEIAKRRKSNLQ